MEEPTRSRIFTLNTEPPGLTVTLRERAEQLQCQKYFYNFSSIQKVTEVQHFPFQCNRCLKLCLIITRRYFIMSTNKTPIKPRLCAGGGGGGGAQLFPPFQWRKTKLPFWGHWNFRVQWLVRAQRMSGSPVQKKQPGEAN